MSYFYYDVKVRFCNAEYFNNVSSVYFYIVYGVKCYYASLLAFFIIYNAC